MTTWNDEIEQSEDLEEFFDNELSSKPQHAPAPKPNKWAVYQQVCQIFLNIKWNNYYFMLYIYVLLGEGGRRRRWIGLKVCFSSSRTTKERKYKK